MIHSKWLKIHSWQCMKLTIPSFFVNVTIEESICIICLKTIYFNNYIFEHILVTPTRLSLSLYGSTSVTNIIIGQNVMLVLNSRCWWRGTPESGIQWCFFISQISHTSLIKCYFRPMFGVRIFVYFLRFSYIQLKADLNFQQLKVKFPLESSVSPQNRVGFVAVLLPMDSWYASPWCDIICLTHI